jgi:hypothetical protein
LKLVPTIFHRALDFGRQWSVSIGVPASTMMTAYTPQIDRSHAEWIGVAARVDLCAMISAGFTGSSHALGSGVT